MFQDFYAEHAPHVYLLALRLTRDRVCAEEVTQDTFVRAWRGLARFRGESSERTWLHAIACRATQDFYRSKQARDRRFVADSEAALRSYTHAVTTTAPDTAIDLERALATLPDGARRPLLLHTIHGLAYHEIAQLLGVTIGTVKSQVHRARSLLLKELER